MDNYRFPTGARAVLIIGILLAMMTFFGRQAFTYDRQSACNYAQKYWNRVCSDGYFFKEMYPPAYLGSEKPVPSAFGHDCAHFVSCCIGNERHEQGGGLVVPSRTAAYGEPGAARLVSWLLDNGGTEESSVSNLDPGDVIAYDRTRDGVIDHVALYLGNGKVAAHSQSWNGGWRLVYSSGFTFIHIGVSTTSTFLIAGRVTRNGKGLRGVSVTLTGPVSKTTTADSNGNYKFTSLTRGIYTVRPSKSGYSFSPPSRRIPVSNTHVTGQDFSATTTGTLSPTATVLVMDVSGSMGWRWKGGVKIESAKEAALQFIEQVTHETQTRGGQHQIGVVAFSDGARLLLPLTSDYNRAKQVIISLHATNWTNVGAGLTTALSEFNKVRSNAQRFIILLSDGNTNRGLSRDQILNGPVVEARRKRICIHTVAFGDPGDVDDDFLRKVGIGSGCGSYSHAETAFELFSTYLKLRHRSLGQVVGEYSSIGKRVTILPGVPISLGTVLIGSGKRELHYTLAWSEQGRLQTRLKDPSGRLVSTSYPRVQIYTTDQFAHLTLLSPKSGAWTVEAAAGTSMPNGTEYYAVLSTRPGGIAIPLPLPVFTVGDRTFGLPSGLPTWLLVTISVTLIALVLYKEFIK